MPIIVAILSVILIAYLIDGERGILILVLVTVATALLIFAWPVLIAVVILYFLYKAGSKR